VLEVVLDDYNFAPMQVVQPVPRFAYMNPANSQLMSLPPHLLPGYMLGMTGHLFTLSIYLISFLSWDKNIVYE
jgi:hypothetical protein